LNSVILTNSFEPLKTAQLVVLSALRKRGENTALSGECLLRKQRGENQALETDSAPAEPGLAAQRRISRRFENEDTETSYCFIFDFI
jgi:hypothetical protein